MAIKIAVVMARIRVDKVAKVIIFISSRAHILTSRLTGSRTLACGEYALTRRLERTSQLLTQLPERQALAAKPNNLFRDANGIRTSLEQECEYAKRNIKHF